MQSLFPTAPNELTDEDLVQLYAYPVERAWVRANFVSSLDGAAQGSDSRSGTLSSVSDKLVFGLLRSLADVIVVGAKTVRTEGYLPVASREHRTSLRNRLGLAPLPAIAVVSRSLDIDPALLAGGEAPTVVITTESASSDLRAEVGAVAPVIVAGRDDVELGVALEELATMGYQRVLCEGGPTLMRDLVASRRADEICLTVTPLMLAGDRMRITHGADIEPPAAYTLRHLLEDDSQLFCRYTRN